MRLAALFLIFSLCAHGAYSWNATTTTATKTSPTGIDTTTCTLVMWVYPKSLGEGGDLGRTWMRGNSVTEITKQVFVRSDTGNGMCFEVWKTTSNASVCNGAASKWTTNAWYMWAFSYTASDGGPRLYYGTSSAAMAEDTGAARSDGSGTLLSETGQRVDIGCRSYDGGRTWDGYIQEVRYYNSVLSVAQLNQIRAGFEPSRSTLIAYWPLNDPALAGADMIGSNTLTVANATWVDAFAPIVRPWAWWAFLLTPWRFLP